jgi:hypothetical protein
VLERVSAMASVSVLALVSVSVLEAVMAKG